MNHAQPKTELSRLRQTAQGPWDSARHGGQLPRCPCSPDEPLEKPEPRTINGPRPGVWGVTRGLSGELGLCLAGMDGAE